MNKTEVLLMGPVATGKTYSTRTLMREYPDEEGRMHKGAGKSVFTVSLEPGWSATMGDCTCDMGMHVQYIAPLDVDWDTLMFQAELVNKASDVTKVTDPNKRDYTQLLDTYSALAKFRCDRCKEEFGPVSRFDDQCAVVMDGLTGLSRNAMTWVTGLKPHKSWPEYDAAGQQVENMLRKCVSIAPTFVLIAHLDREMDTVSQAMKLTMHTIGNKLAPRLTKDLFSEIILTRRDDRGRFWWSTSEPNMDLKARSLPFSDNITPDFGLLLEAIR
jgi:AAA domain